MNVAELKIDLINKITQVKDVRIIEEIQKFLAFELDKSEYKLSDSQKKRLLEAKHDNILTEEQANKEIEEWLKT